ncbi:MAG: hypothetical protein DMG30_24690 [Acidobacteria bacterium]|nr:MAG: hypothetical protein DMG30_24690 [Acidobacteriota bacterium]
MTALMCSCCCRPFDLGAMELLTKIELLPVEIFRVFPIQQSFQAAVIVEEKGLVRDVLALPDPTRVGRGDSSIATGASVFANGVRLNRQTFH